MLITELSDNGFVPRLLLIDAALVREDRSSFALMMATAYQPPSVCQAASSASSIADTKGRTSRELRDSCPCSVVQIYNNPLAIGLHFDNNGHLIW